MDSEWQTIRWPLDYARGIKKSAPQGISKPVFPKSSHWRRDVMKWVESLWVGPCLRPTAIGQVWSINTQRFYHWIIPTNWLGLLRYFSRKVARNPLFGFFVGRVFTADFAVFTKIQPIGSIDRIFARIINILLAFTTHQFNNRAFIFMGWFFLNNHDI